MQQEKVTFSVVAAYGKGDMKDESQKSKCFLKCFAENLELYSNVTGDPDKEKLIEYINYLKPSNMPVSKLNDIFIFYNKIKFSKIFSVPRLRRFMLSSGTTF